MKRSTIIFLSFVLVFSTLLCAGCNKKNQSENNQNQESINEMSGTDLTFTGALQKHTAELGTILYYKVSNDKIVFSFSDYIKINKSLANLPPLKNSTSPTLTITRDIPFWR